MLHATASTMSAPPSMASAQTSTPLWPGSRKVLQVGGETLSSFAQRQLILGAEAKDIHPFTHTAPLRTTSLASPTKRAACTSAVGLSLA